MATFTHSLFVLITSLLFITSSSARANPLSCLAAPCPTSYIEYGVITVTMSIKAYPDATGKCMYSDGHFDGFCRYDRTTFELVGRPGQDENRFSCPLVGVARPADCDGPSTTSTNAVVSTTTSSSQAMSISASTASLCTTAGCSTSTTTMSRTMQSSVFLSIPSTISSATTFSSLPSSTSSAMPTISSLCTTAACVTYSSTTKLSDPTTTTTPSTGCKGLSKPEVKCESLSTSKLTAKPSTAVSSITTNFYSANMTQTVSITRCISSSCTSYVVPVSSVPYGNNTLSTLATVQTPCTISPCTTSAAPLPSLQGTIQPTSTLPITTRSAPLTSGTLPTSTSSSQNGSVGDITEGTQAPDHTTTTIVAGIGSTSQPADMTDDVSIPRPTSAPSPVVIIFPGIAKAVSPCKMMLMLDFLLVVMVYVMC